MAKGRGRVRIETGDESPRTYNVRKGEEVTVRTKHEKPEITGGGGGGGENLGGNLIGCFIIFIIFIILAIKAVDYTVNLVEVNVVKKINSNYVTRHEVAKEEERKQKKIAEEEARIRKEKQKIELELEIKEDLLEQKILRFVNPRKVETILRNKGYAFEIGYFVYSGSYVYAIDNNIWVCGDLVREDANKQKYYFPALAFSNSGGKEYNILKIFEELVGTCVSHSALLFLNKKNGYLAIYSMGGGPSWIYETNDGGFNWNKILTVNSIPIKNASNCINRIRIAKKNICLIISFEGGEDHKYTGLDHDFIESTDSGKTWTYKRNYKEVVETFDKGLTWEAVKNKK